VPDRPRLRHLAGALACLLGLAAGAEAATRVRFVASNLTSGRRQRYEEPGLRILEGLKPDVILLQRFRYGDDDEESIRRFVRRVLGGPGYFYREPEDALGAVPNAIVSRYPILESGQWRDVEVYDRDFAWALIDVPGRRNLLAVSVNFKAGDGTSDRRRRTREAKALVRRLGISRAARHWLVVGGTLATRDRGEPCVAILGERVAVDEPWPEDGAGNDATSVNRDFPEDWLLADEDLVEREAAITAEGLRAEHGLVFDTRALKSLNDFAPARRRDDYKRGMHHHAVVRDFMLGGGR